MRLCIVIVNYRTPGLVLDALDSLEGQIEAGLDEIVVVDNASGDESAERLERAIGQRGLSRFCRVVCAPKNGGFAAGVNCGVRAVEANYYLFMNADVIVRKGAIQALLAQMQAHPGVGIAGPRLEWSDGTIQASCFRDHTPLSELLGAARTHPLNQFLREFELTMPATDEPCEAQWVSFACVLIRREVIEKVGLLDEGYFMYFEDSDYCRATRAAGFRIRYCPNARVVHLRGGISEVGRQHAERQRPPRYLYESRTRYFRKGYGVLGFVMANVLWYVGRGVSFGRELVGHKAPHTWEKQWRDNWIDTFRIGS
jgi:GT2 family glycosyltransferase